MHMWSDRTQLQQLTRWPLNSSCITLYHHNRHQCCCENARHSSRVADTHFKNVAVSWYIARVYCQTSWQTTYRITYIRNFFSRDAIAKCGICNYVYPCGLYRRQLINESSKFSNNNNNNNNKLSKEFWRKAESQGDFYAENLTWHLSASAADKVIGVVACVRVVAPVRAVAL